MKGELHGNVACHGVELLLLVSVLFLLAIPKSLLILEEFLYTSLYSFLHIQRTSYAYGYIRLILELTNTYPFLKAMKIAQKIKHSYATPNEPAAVLP